MNVDFTQRTTYITYNVFCFLPTIQKVWAHNVNVNARRKWNLGTTNEDLLGDTACLLSTFT